MHVLIDIDLFTYCNSLEFHSNKVHMLERCREDDSIQLKKKNLSVAIKSLRFWFEPNVSCAALITRCIRLGIGMKLGNVELYLLLWDIMFCRAHVYFSTLPHQRPIPPRSRSSSVLYTLYIHLLRVYLHQKRKAVGRGKTFWLNTKI